MTSHVSDVTPRKDYLRISDYILMIYGAGKLQVNSGRPRERDEAGRILQQSLSRGREIKTSGQMIDQERVEVDRIGFSRSHFCGGERALKNDCDG
jgi:hypothetical protein